MSIIPIVPIETISAAVAAGAAAVGDPSVAYYDLTGHMTKTGVPLHLRSAWLIGYEDGLEQAGFVIDEADENGRGWENRALAKAA